MNYKAYVRSEETSFSLRLDYILATLPVIIWAVIRFGFSAFMVLTLSVASALVTDFVCRSVKERRIIKPSLYAAFCGILFSFMLYEEVPYIFVVFGGALTAAFVNVFGGEGKSIVFAPVVVRVLLYGFFDGFLPVPADLPYESLILKRIPAQSVFGCSLGAVEGSFGTISAVALVFGAIYLLLRKNVDFTVSVAYLITAAVLFFVFPCIQGSNLESMTYELLTSGVIFVAAFLLNDYSLLQNKTAHKIVIGVICGALTFAFRLLGFDHQAVYVAYLTSVLVCFVIIKFASAGKGKYEK